VRERGKRREEKRRYPSIKGERKHTYTASK